MATTIRGSDNFDTGIPEIAGENLGKVLQVINTRLTSSISGTGTSFTDIVSATITPKSTTSKIYVQFNLIYGNDGTNAHFKFNITRNGASVGTQSWYDGTYFGGIYTPTGTAPSASTAFHMSYDYMDNPSSTAAQTYTIQFAPNNSCTWYVGRRSSSEFGFRPSITLMEIA